MLSSISIQKLGPLKNFRKQLKINGLKYKIHTEYETQIQTSVGNQTSK